MKPTYLIRVTSRPRKTASPSKRLALDGNRKCREPGRRAVRASRPRARPSIPWNAHTWLTEFRIYRRDDKGRIVKPASPDHPGDHLTDATCYLVMSGLRRAVAKPINRLRDNEWPAAVRSRSQHEYDYDPLPYR